MMPDDDRYLSLSELVRYAGLSRGTLTRCLQRAEDPLPHYRVGDRILVKRSEYDAWLARGTVQTRRRNEAFHAKVQDAVESLRRH